MLGVLLWRHSVHSQQQPQNGVSVSNKQSNSKQPSTQNATQPKPKPKSKPEPEPKPNTNYCVGNTLSKLVLVSISKQHLWACDRTASLYNSAVVTGMELYPSDLTPPGTYHVYAKATNQDLKGCDATGCWDDHVSYWMPFLDNQYGQYGFHDAAWRKPSQFGNINIYAPDTAALFGSHGCVELPLATAKWLYNWAPVGTTVKVES
jgi:lipoprotein-anchoring transpeptidase ErfK/SrfK